MFYKTYPSHQLCAAGALVMPPGQAKQNKDGKMKCAVRGEPFKTAFAPYGNNPHHILPDATLKDGILEVTDSVPQVKDMIIQGLLEEKYNMNHFENVMILPVSEKDGCPMGLPCHPTNHNKLDKEIKKKVLKALKPYDKVVRAVVQGKEHDNPDPEEIKDDIVEISKTIHRNIVSAY